MYIFAFTASFIILTAAIIIAVSLSRRKINRKYIFTPLNVLILGTFLAAALLFFPHFMFSFQQEKAGIQILKAILLSMHSSLQLFTIGSSFDNLRGFIGTLNETFADLYSLYASLIYLLAPLLTFSFLLSFFKNITSYRKYLLTYRRDIYVFSELNERALSLATDIYQNHNAVIIFAAVCAQNASLLPQAEMIKAICFKKDLLSINFHLHAQTAKITFFTIKTDEYENLKQTCELIKTYRDRPNTELYLFSAAAESEPLLAGMNKGQIKIRRIHEARSLIYRTLYDQGELLFKTAKPTADDKKEISAVIIGMGSCGIELLKALPWFCQMDHYHITIDAFDKDAAAASKFSALCPELMSEQCNGTCIEGEAQYQINIHSDTRYDTMEFRTAIKSIKHATYAFIALEQEEETIKTAFLLRQLFEQMHIHPLIHAVISNSEKAKALSDIKNYRLQPYDITWIGDTSSLYSEAVMMNSPLEQEALKRHLKWGKEADFWAYEYYYRSSTASALHRKMRIACAVPGADKKEEDLTKSEADNLEQLEHRRWNAYMRSEGYQYSGSTDPKTRNDLGKLHHDLVVFQELSEEEKRKDSRVGSA